MIRKTRFVLSFFIFSFCLLWVVQGRAQSNTTIQVATKTVEKSFVYIEGASLNLEGEKAEINVKPWDENLIKVVFEIISRHPDKETAAKGLGLMEYSLQRTASGVDLKNWLSNDNVKKGGASLKVRYTIYLPPDCPLFIENNFGKVDVGNLMNQLKINSEFCKILLDNLNGEILIETRYGNIEGMDLFGDLQIDAYRSDITLNRFSGDARIQASYALIRILATNDLSSMDITADNSDVQFIQPDFSSHNYELFTQYGNVVVPPGMNFNFSPNGNTNRRAVFQGSPELPGFSVRVHVSSGNIKVSDQYFDF